MRPPRAVRRLIPALPFLLLAPLPALAAWPHDPSIGAIPVTTAANDQSFPSSISDGAGGAFYAWTNGGIGVLVQHVSAAGTPLWTPNGVAICVTGTAQSGPFLVPDGAGGVIVGWNDLRFGAANICAQRVNAAGVPQWTTDGIFVCSAAGDQTSVQVVSDGAAGMIATWADMRSGNSDIYAQRVNGAGAPQWTANGVLLCSAVNDQTVPQIVTDGAGGAIVVWQDQRAGVGVLDVWGQRVNAAGVVQWAANGLAFCPATGNQTGPKLVSDGLGGVITVWYDARNGGGNDIYAQRTNSVGAMLWNGNGVAVCTATNEQNVPQLASDGSGGAVVAWTDFRNGGVQDVFAQRVNSSGAMMWTANGVALCTATLTQAAVAISSDGAQGAIVGWQDYRGTGIPDVYAQRVNGAGTTQWTTDGVAVCTAVGAQQGITIVGDGAGGAILAWMDNRGNDADIYAQRVETYGALGNPEPGIVNVRDVPGDEGGKVRVTWSSSYLDADLWNSVVSYWIWRQAPAALATAAIARGARLDGEGGPSATSAAGLWKRTVDAGQVFYWEYVGSQPAQGFAGYSMVTATTGDSSAAGNPRTYFMVEAKSSGSAHWASVPDSGYSVDNLAPATPAPFTGQYAAGATALHWGGNGEADFSEYRLYRGSSPSFVPGPSNFVVAPTDTGYLDVPGGPYYYKLAAADVHGNVSPFALLLPSGTVAVSEGPAAAEVALALANGNPVHSGAELRFIVPRAGSARLAVFDARGRRVRALAQGACAAGTHAVRWDGRDATGAVAPSGLYFARLEVSGVARTVRFTLLH